MRWRRAGREPCLLNKGCSYLWLRSGDTQYTWRRAADVQTTCCLEPKCRMQRHNQPNLQWSADRGEGVVATQSCAHRYVRYIPNIYHWLLLAKRKSQWYILPLAAPPPCADSSTQASGVDRQEFGGRVESARHWRRVELWRPEPRSYWLPCFRPTGQWLAHLSHCWVRIWLYCGVIRVRCYPFDMTHHRFRGKNVKVCQLHLHKY